MQSPSAVNTAAPTHTVPIAGHRSRAHAAARTAGWVVLAVTAVGFVLRSLRLGWQPLWWDEGYSVYFATEPLGRMLWLTAHDIHPPLYYALLHGWLALQGNAAPFGDRLLSVALGVIALPLQFRLAQLLFPGRLRPAVIALLLLTFSPIHLYYSQEVRMYGLALALGLAASLALWRLVQRLEQLPLRTAMLSWPGLGYGLAYLLAGLALLYTLYYGALLLAAHAVWATVRLGRLGRSGRDGLPALLGLAAIYGGMFLLYLPWLVYAVPLLVGYVGGKVQSDADVALGPLAYAERHLVAFTAGQVRLAALPSDIIALAPATFAICLLILGMVLQVTLRSSRSSTKEVAAPPAHSTSVAAGAAAGAVPALWLWLLAPVALGWLINLRLPFFPVGGERLLLIVLPYFLLLLAYAVDRTWNVWWLGRLALLALGLNAALGIAAFYTTPRYVADDYRPLLRQAVQQGTNQDALLAIFPWQVGYWRAYAPQDARITGPSPVLLSDGAVEWSPQVAAEVDAALQRGVLWFPEPLTFGSSLPHAIEQHLEQSAVNVENRWYDATRLTAWSKLTAPPSQATNADFGRLRLTAAGIAPAAAAAANQPLAVQLAWQPAQAGKYNVSLRIQDDAGHVWSSREYEQDFPAAGEVLSTTVGLIVPVGLPPGGYIVTVSVQTPAGETLTVAGSNSVFARVAPLEVTQPDAPQPEERLPIRTRLAQPVLSGGLALLGYSGIDPQAGQMAGSELAVTLFLADRSSDPVERAVYVSLLDPQGQGVAGYAGWPLPEYPTAAWPKGALAQVPVSFFVPGSLTTGEYTLVAGFVEPASGAKTPPVELARVQVKQRAASFSRPTPQHPFDPPPQVGTHARLLGYDLDQGSDGSVAVRLYWEVLQPLLPPHHIFVHLDDADGRTVAQQDGPPVGADGPAPTGSWQPGEFLTTTHPLPGPLPEGSVLRVGLYDPTTDIRLPVTRNGQPAGDNVVLK